MTMRQDEQRQTNQRIAIVNGGEEVVALLDAIVEPGAYSIEFVPLGHRVHARIKSLAPDMVVLCTRIDEPVGFQLLTGLKLDPATREIPVLTFTTEHEDQEYYDSTGLLADDDFGPYVPARTQLRMN